MELGVEVEHKHTTYLVWTFFVLHKYTRKFYVKHY